MKALHIQARKQLLDAMAALRSAEKQINDAAGNLEADHRMAMLAGELRFLAATLKSGHAIADVIRAQIPVVLDCVRSGSYVDKG